ncbi:NAD(P)-dependent oxidoreductase [Mycobacterium simiae]|uniref:NAD(P)-dependent oxidoreductase n=1 Tax=Mycobacterium simiae TaxID=1784 RepID=A0A1X0XRM5_MYCSI|nr:hypothetical protein B5M45_24685 [Mycobacterium simiae]
MILPWKSKNSASRDAPMACNGASANTAASDQLSIVVIGVGPLGLPVAVRLRQAGFPLVGIDVCPDRAACAAARGIVMANSIVAATTGASIAISALPHPAALQHLATQLQQCTDHRIRYVIDISPLSPSAKILAAAAFEAIGITLLDCAVVGSSAQILDRDVLVCASGPESAFGPIRPVLSALSTRVEYVGELGAGTKMKAVANHLGVLYNTAIAETLSLADRIGLCPGMAWRIMNGDGTISDQFELRGALMASGTYGPSSTTVSSCVKEVDLIADLARSVEAPTPLLDTAAALYRVAESIGYGDHDSSAVHASYIQLPHP